MNPHDCDDIFSQYVYFISKCRDLIRLIRSDFEDKTAIDVVVDELSEILSKYYMNFDLCSSCGHPIPSLPSVMLKDKISHVMANYIDLYEFQSGEKFPELFLQPSNFNYVEPVKESSKLALSPRLVSLGEEKKIKVIKAKLLRVE